MKKSSLPSSFIIMAVFVMVCFALSSSMESVTAAEFYTLYTYNTSTNCTGEPAFYRIYDIDKCTSYMTATLNFSVYSFINATFNNDVIQAKSFINSLNCTAVDGQINPTDYFPINQCYEQHSEGISNFAQMDTSTSTTAASSTASTAFSSGTPIQTTSSQAVTSSTTLTSQIVPASTTFSSSSVEPSTTTASTSTGQTTYSAATSSSPSPSTSSPSTSSSGGRGAHGGRAAEDEADTQARNQPVIIGASVGAAVVIVIALYVFYMMSKHNANQNNSNNQSPISSRFEVQMRTSRDDEITRYSEVTPAV